MDQPYVLAKVHKSASSAEFHVYTAPTKTGLTSFSSRELVAAIDSQGVNIYNLATSYSLSPSTKFHCSPVSVVDRLASTRYTYAALQTGSDQLRVQCWKETNAGSETQVTTYDLKTKVMGLHHLGHSVLLVYINGDIERLEADLSASLEKVLGTSYLDSQSRSVLHQSIGFAEDDPNNFRLRIISSGEKLRMNSIVFPSSEDEKKAETTIIQTEIPFTKGVKELLAEQIAVGEKGQVAVSFTGSKHFEVYLFDAAQKETQAVRISRTKQVERNPVSMRWLNATQLVFSHGVEASIWDTTYKTCQSTMSLEETAAVTAIVPQKSAHSAKSVAYLVLCSATNILLSQITFNKKASLLEAIGNNRKPIKLSDSWLQDVDIQSTWKDSLSVISDAALMCLDALSEAQSGEEFDAIMEDFLFPETDTANVRTKILKKAARLNSSTAAPSSRKQRAPRSKKQLAAAEEQTLAAAGNGTTQPITNGHHKNDEDSVMTNGLAGHAVSAEPIDSDQEDAELETALSKEVASRQFPSRQAFDTYTTDVALSSPFVSQLLKLIFRDLPSKSQVNSTPEATIDFLLKKNLLSFSGSSGSELLLTIIKTRPDLRLRLVNDVVGLLPDQLLDILLTFLDDADVLRSAVAAVIRKLDTFDETMVTLAIRSKLAHPQISSLMSLLDEELHIRLSNIDHDNRIPVSDEVLCSAITRFLDSVGVANLVLSSIPDTLLLSLRTAVNHLIARTGEIASTAGHISELLMKARLLETHKAPRLDPGSTDTAVIDSNPEPQAKKGSLALDQVKKTDKNQTRRAKAYVRVQGIGSVYTIETLQI